MQLKEIFEKNGYDNKFFDSCLRTFLNNICSKKVRTHSSWKKVLYFPPLFREIVEIKRLGKIYFIYFIRSTFRNILPCANLKIVFRIKNKLSSKFTFKNKISDRMRFLLCYKFQCSSCNATCYGKTKHQFKVRVSEHMGVSARTGKNIKSTKNSAVRVIC